MKAKQCRVQSIPAVETYILNSTPPLAHRVKPTNEAEMVPRKKTTAPKHRSDVNGNMMTEACSPGATPPASPSIAPAPRLLHFV